MIVRAKAGVLLMKIRPTNTICCFVFASAWILAGVVPLIAAPTKIVTGPDTGFPPQVNTYSPDGTSTGSFFAETQTFTGGIRVALANVVGSNDIITGAGPGAGP